MKHLFDLRAKVVTDQRVILDKAKAEVRGLTADERATVATMDAAIDGYTADIETAKKADERAKMLAQPDSPRVGLKANPADPHNPTAPSADEAQAAFRSWLRFGPEELTPEERAILNPRRPSEDGRPARRGRGSVIELRAAQSAVTGSAGGYTVSQGFVPAVEKSLLAFGGMLQAADVFPTGSGNDLPWPTVDDTSVVGELLAENTAAAQTGITFGQIVFKAYKYSSKEVLVPTELLEDADVNVEAIIANLQGERIGRIINTHFTTGDNSSKPQGVVTASSAGKTTASATAIVVGEILDLFHSVDPAYRDGPKVAFMFKDSTFAAIRKLTLADWAGAQAIWQPGLAPGAPDRILGKPYFINQDMDAIATAKKTILFGDFSKYKIRDVSGFRLNRLVERYGEKDQVSFILFKRYDGRTLDAGTDPIKHLLQA